MDLDLSDLLAPPRSEHPCPVAAALDAIPQHAADQLRPIVADMRARYEPRKVIMLPQANIVAAFDRCGHHVPEQALREHLQSRCTCA